MPQDIRNIAVIAHVDHGKTTLTDALLKQTHTFRDNQAEMAQSQILDSNDLEREKGITIMAKNAAIYYQNTKINIIDTPGHADFSGEVERTLNMADGALLIIDAQEGPMPQTRFVLRKAFEQNLKIIVVINKIDKPYARIPWVVNQTHDLFLELATKDEQLDFPILFGVGRDGKVFSTPPTDFNQPGDITPLLDAVIQYIPAPQGDPQKPFAMLVSALSYDPHLGRILIGKINQGTLKQNARLVISNKGSQTYPVETLMAYKGLSRTPTELAEAGDIVCLSGLPLAKIGDTLADPANPTILPSPSIAEPTLHMLIGPNTSPFSGKEGKFGTSRQIEERLVKELETDLSLRLERLENGKFKISGRGELHLSILLETLRREGFEVEVGKPEVIIKEVNGIKSEPIEEVTIIVPETHLGVITQEIGKRSGHLIKMDPLHNSEVQFVYHMPTRTIIGLRNLLLTATNGTVVFHSQFLDYQPLGKIIPQLRSGVLIASESGDALAYGLDAAQERGKTFVEPGEKVYEGMIVGQNARAEDIEINVTKGKQLTNMRSKSSDGVIQLAPPIKFSLEQSLDFLEDDELLEITPQSLRLRKKYLTSIDRRRHSRQERHDSR